VPATAASIAGVTATVSRPGRRLTGLALVAAATLTASACGSVQAGAAAVVGNRRISVADLQQATTDITTYAKAQDATSTVAQDKVLLFLILEPDLVQAAADAGVGVSEDTARSELAKYSVPKPSQGAVDAIRSLAALNSLQSANKQQELASFATKLRAEKIDVNPRYGRFDPASLNIVAVTPNWLVATPTPTTAGAGSGGGSSSGSGSGSGGGSGGAGTGQAPTPPTTTP
jgi:hypothetical protein